MRISPLHISVKYPSSLDSFVAEGSWKGMKLEREKGENVIVGDFSFKQNGERLTDNLWLGTFELVLDSINIKDKERTNIGLSGLKVTGGTEAEDDDHFSSSVKFSLAKLNVLNPSDKQSPIALKDQVFELNLKKIAITELDALVALSDDFRRADQMTDPTEQVRAQMEMMGKLIDKSTALLNKGLVVEIPELAFSNSEGRAKSSLRLEQASGSWDKSKPNAELLEKTSGTLSIDIPVKMLNALPREGAMFKQQLEGLVQSEFVVLKDGHYRVNATLASMVVNLNGKDMPLPAL